MKHTAVCLLVHAPLPLTGAATRRRVPGFDRGDSLRTEGDLVWL